MNLQQLQTLAVVVETGSFSAAARRLQKAQSAVSSAIAELEIDLGIQLFDRSKRYPQLTAAGERVLQQALIINAQCQALSEFAAGLSDGEESTLTLAVDDEGQLPWLAPILAEFALAFPRLELRLLFPLLEDLTLLLRQGEADLAISYQPLSPPTDIERWPLQAINFVLLVAVTHPLAAFVEDGVTTNQLQQHRQLLVTDRLQGVEKQRGRLAADVWWLEGDMAVLALVKQGLGWAWLPEPLAQTALAEQPKALLPLHLKDTAGLPSSILPVQLELWRQRGKTPGPAARWLLQRLLNRV
ncbi:LysR family transcriptional regulator [Rheinheimera riviphila]|uniref:LysR family transcriptional regulator n=1 Tax=Rheinheimera riviphila TaxID=1834037 RepID=A0A437QFA1_9GAMM|nr:LysR family transcriptional regulator [Rheinheimera riviphila]RVU33259.1 LysR family transcriptional regulator [Rheinheimera riviphila]